MQTYSCNDCNKKWSSERRQRVSFEKRLWSQYIFNKQTVRELSKTYQKDKRVIRNHLDSYASARKIHYPRKINLVVDGTYWGERKEQTSWCSILARDPKRKENLWWSFEQTETTSVYLRCHLELEKLGYTILSVTGDGFGGIRQGFSDLPFQMCHVHMERLVIKGTTKKPELEAGMVLLALVRSLPETDSQIFNRRLGQYIEKYREFLNERTTHPFSDNWSWTHENLRQAVRSLLYFQKYLFTFELGKGIPKTTNSVEGHFRHIKDVINIHCGLTRPQKERVLDSIFLASSIAPSKKKLDEIL